MRLQAWLLDSPDPKTLSPNGPRGQPPPWTFAWIQRDATYAARAKKSLPGRVMSNHRKTTGKAWENGGFPWDFMGFTRPGND